MHLNKSENYGHSQYNAFYNKFGFKSHKYVKDNYEIKLKNGGRKEKVFDKIPCDRVKYLVFQGSVVH